MFGLRCLKVLRTVDFHNQLHDRGVEIDDVVTDWFLSIELHCEDLLSAQTSPQALLRVGQVRSQ